MLLVNTSRRANYIRLARYIKRVNRYIVALRGKIIVYRLEKGIFVEVPTVVNNEEIWYVVRGGNSYSIPGVCNVKCVWHYTHYGFGTYLCCNNGGIYYHRLQYVGNLHSMPRFVLRLLCCSC